MPPPIRMLGLLIVGACVALLLYGWGAALGPVWALGALVATVCGIFLCWRTATGYYARRLNPLPPPEQCATGASGHPLIDTWARVHRRVKTARSVGEAMFASEELRR